jgi:aminopeptidase-like protein
LSYGEIVLPGRREEEILISAHACHPSLANDNLSGLVVARSLAWHLADRPRRFTYRFVFAPGTVGAIAFLARSKELLSLIRGGLIVAGVGDRGAFTYKRSRAGVAEMDRIVARLLRESGDDHRILDFSPDGYDERQYNSPGFALPVGRLSRTPWGSYPQYHTSGDDLNFISEQSLAEALELLLRICGELEENSYYRNLLPEGEPQLGRRGLYTLLGGHRGKSERESAMLWLLNYSDGFHSLRDIAELSGHERNLLAEMAGVLEEHALLRKED